MKLAQAYMEARTKSRAEAAQNTQSQQATNSFDKVFEKQVNTDKTQNTQRAEKPQERRQPVEDTRQKPVEKEKAHPADAERKPETEAKPVAKDKVAPQEKTDTATTETGDTTSAEDATKEAISAIAAQLQVSETVISQLLTQLNMTPLDLADKTKMQGFLQGLYKVATPVELLHVPQIAQTVSALEETIQTLVAQAKAAQPTNLVEAALQKATEPQTQTMVQTAQATTVKAETPTEVPQEPTAKEAPKATATIVTQSTGTQSQSQGGAGQNLSDQNKDILAQPKTMDVSALTKAEVSTATFEKAIAKTQTATTVNTQDVVNQIVEKVKVEVRGNVSEIKIVLKPEHLGDVTMKVVTENGIVTASFVAESQKVKEIIEANFNQLRDTLEQQGLQIGSMSVSVGQGKADEQMEQFLQNQQKGAARRNQLIGGILTDDVAEEPIIDTTQLLENSVDYQA